MVPPCAYPKTTHKTQMLINNHQSSCVDEHDLSSGPGACPMFDTLECLPVRRDFCTDDSTCIEGLKCCDTGCENNCVGKLRGELQTFCCVFWSFNFKYLTQRLVSKVVLV